jgi:fructuronate reductase
MTSLSLCTVDRLPASVARPGYDPRGVAVGVVHFGPGAFHRAHQATYFDALLADDPRWGIAAVSLRSSDTVSALAAQDGLYSVAMLDADPAYRVIGAHRDWIGPDAQERLIARLADPSLHLVTATVTEKGYCLSGDGDLDLAHPDIIHDRQAAGAWRSLAGWLTAGLAERRASGLAPFATLCCDNMARNGAKLRGAVVALARLRDDGLADWIAETAVFPDTMVDSITPATDDAHRLRAARVLGMADHAAVQRERFAQWVVQDLPLPGSPDLERTGVIRTGDVAAYEQAKLRILNGAHSSLAYLGLALGHETVADAMADPVLAGFIERLVRDDIIPSLGVVAGLDLAGYADQVLERFRNPAIRHHLSQIAWDGSQKLPYRLLDTVGEALAHDRPVDRLAVPVAGWIAFIRASLETGRALVDPLADRLIAIARREGDPARLAGAMLDIDGLFRPAIAQAPRFRDAVRDALAAVTTNRTRNLLTM